MKSIELAVLLKKELDTLRPFKKEHELRIMQKFRLDWNYHSNHLEGNSLTFGETKALILFGVTAQGKPLKDHFEMSGHDEAVKWILDVVKEERPLTESFIRELHELILKEPYEVDAITPSGEPTKKKVVPGRYKEEPNHVKTKTGEIFRFASPEETPALMKDLMDWYRKKSAEKERNPILIASEFHYKFIRIHPFDDGNGRTVRILMNFILMKLGYPPVVIKTDDKENYFGALRQADAGQLEPFVDYIARNLIRSLELMIKGAKGEAIEEPDDIDKEIALLENRLNEISKPITTSRTKDAILELYDDSVARLLDRFIKKCTLLEKFYFDNQFLLFVDGGASHYAKEKSFQNNRVKIHENTSSLELRYNYRTFKHTGFKEFNHTSKIEFKFNLTTYKVFDSNNNIIIEKHYGHQLTEKEVNGLVDSEMKAHKNFIEKKITELKSNEKN